MTLAEFMLSVGLFVTTTAAAAVWALCAASAKERDREASVRRKLAEQVRQYRRLNLASIRLDLIEDLLDNAGVEEDEEIDGPDQGPGEAPRA